MMGINRNIVECKDFSGISTPPDGKCINRNIVECKVIFTIKRMIWNSGINRNIVECKDANMDY